MSEALLEITGLRKAYPGLSGFSLEIPSLEIRASEVIGLIGRNGAGKTTLMRSLMGVVRADAGEIRYEGQSMTSDLSALRRIVGYVPEEPCLYETMKVGAILQFVGGLYPSWDRARAIELLDFFELDPQKKVRALSKGMRTKLLLIMAVCHSSKLLILDEPTSGFDPVAKDEFWDFLRRLLDTGEIKAAMISSHQLGEVEAICNRAVFLERGRSIFDQVEFSAAELKGLFARSER
ncbi:MAG: ABC transporter ATP-binding protein [Candidatus Acidiferrales bacterium]